MGQDFGKYAEHCLTGDTVRLAFSGPFQPNLARFIPVLDHFSLS